MARPGISTKSAEKCPAARNSVAWRNYLENNQSWHVWYFRGISLAFSVVLSGLPELRARVYFSFFFVEIPDPAIPISHRTENTGGTI